MTLFYSLNILLLFILTFWPAWFSRTILHLPWINPFSISLAVSLPVEILKIIGGPILLIEDGLLDIGYQYSILMTSVLLIFQAAGAVFFYRISNTINVQRFMPFKKILLKKMDLKRISIFFLLGYIFSILMLANADFGVANWILNPREGYQLHRTGLGHWYALATSFLAVSYVFSCLARKTANGILMSSIFFILMGYFLGTKAILLSIFTSTLIFLWFFRWPHLVGLLFLGAPFIFILLIFNLYLALGDGFEFISIVGYFDHFMNASNYYNDYLSNRVELFYGDIFTTSFWAYIPRFLFSEKPFVYGILLINEIYYPGMAELTHTPAFGGAVEQFADFGLPGVAFFGFFSPTAIFTGISSYLIFRRPGFNVEHISILTAILMLVQYGPSFGNFLPGGLYFLLVFIVSILIVILKIFSNNFRI